MIDGPGWEISSCLGTSVYPLLDGSVYFRDFLICLSSGGLVLALLFLSRDKVRVSSDEGCLGPLGPGPRKLAPAAFCVFFNMDWLSSLCRDPVSRWDVDWIRSDERDLVSPSPGGVPLADVCTSCDMDLLGSGEKYLVSPSPGGVPLADVCVSCDVDRLGSDEMDLVSPSHGGVPLADVCTSCDVD